MFNSMYLVGLAIIALPLLIRHRSKSIQARVEKNGEKSIDLANVYFWLMYVTSALFIIIGISAFLFSNEPIASIGFTGIGCVFFAATAIIQFANTTVHWSHQYISGPRSGFSFKRNIIDWDNIIMAKYNKNNTIELVSISGLKVCWSVYHAGWLEVIIDMQRIKPDADTSDFEEFTSN